MVRLMRSCMQSILKLLNSVIGMVGLGMILYAVWLIRVWQREMGDFPFEDDSDNPAPWFIYTFLGLGVTLCVITCVGHVAAETANGCCLYLYMLFVFVLFMLEAGVSADVFLNRDWEKDFPKDPTGSFNQFKDFIRSNFEICKWIGLSIVSVQKLLCSALHPLISRAMYLFGLAIAISIVLSNSRDALSLEIKGLSFLLALILKALGPHQYCDSDDEFTPDRVPLLNNAVIPPPYVVGSPVVGSRNDAWSIRINEKVNQSSR